MSSSVATVTKAAKAAGAVQPTGPESTWVIGLFSAIILFIVFWSASISLDSGHREWRNPFFGIFNGKEGYEAFLHGP
jgi:hypothetical protein